MKRSRLLLRNLTYYRRTNLPVIAGVAIAVAVLSGALLVGQSVRASLRRLLYERIGATEYLVTAEHFFSERLASPLNSGIDSCPIIYLKGVVIHEPTGVRIHQVNVYGVDDRFWKFHGVDVPAFPDDRAAYVGDSLARHLNIKKEDALLLRVEIPQAIPREWLYGRRDNGGRTLRLNCRRLLSGAQLGEFSLRPTQGSVHSDFRAIEATAEGPCAAGANQRPGIGAASDRKWAGIDLEPFEEELHSAGSCNSDSDAHLGKWIFAGEQQHHPGHCNRAGSESDSGRHGDGILPCVYVSCEFHPGRRA